MEHGLRKTAARSFFELGRRLDSEAGHNNSDEILGSQHEGNPNVDERSVPEVDNPNDEKKPAVNTLALFKEKIREFKNPRILELGSRAVTKEALRYMLDLNASHEYVGLDIHEGPNVEIVGDAHKLRSIFPKEHFDVVMSKAVFEHLAMPWKAILEINSILKKGGLLFINTLHTFPLHEQPWDFWRFSEEAWNILLNKWTGFEIIYKNMEFPCKVVPEMDIQDWEKGHEAYLLSNVLAKKISVYDENRFKWDIDIEDILDSSYPKQP